MGMSVSAYAKHRGVSRQAVYKAIKAGRIAQNDDGSIDAGKADRDWSTNSDPAKKREPVAFSGGVEQAPSTGALGNDPKPSQRTAGFAQSAAPAQGLDYNRLRGQKLATDIARGQLALREAQGELIKKAEVKSLLFARARQDRDMVLNFSNRFGAQVAAETGADARLVMAALDKYLRDLLEEMAAQPLELKGL